MKLRNMLSRRKKQVPGEYKYDIIFYKSNTIKIKQYIFHGFLISDKKKSKEMVSRKFRIVTTGEGVEGRRGGGCNW